MRALRAHRRGGPEVLVLEQAPRPAPAAGEVLVEVHAAAITFDELTWEETWSHLPTIPSHEMSGTVFALGAGVTDWSVGDEVYGLIRFDRDGAAAEFVALPSADLAARPRTVPHAVAAALPLAGLTAWQALVDHAHVAAGEHVLVLGGAGGVGALTVQLADQLGAHVSTTVRSDQARDLASGLGAEQIIDTRTTATPQGCFDVVIDTVGGDMLRAGFAATRPGGRLVTLSAPPPDGLADEHGITATFFIVTPDTGELAELATRLDAGRLQVQLAATFDLTQGRQAYESKARHLPGKTVLVVKD